MHRVKIYLNILEPCSKSPRRIITHVRCYCCINITDPECISCDVFLDVVTEASREALQVSWLGLKVLKSDVNSLSPAASHCNTAFVIASETPGPKNATSVTVVLFVSILFEKDFCLARRLFNKDIVHFPRD